MKALIIDDERLARVALRRLISEYPLIEIVGEAEDTDDALAQITKLHPDVLFLDVQMPGKDGFQLLAELETIPMVIFTTAYDEYALRAFQVSALDYLVKPIEHEHLARAVEKLRAFAPPPSSPSPSSAPQYLTAEHQIFVKDGDKCWFVKVGDIRLLESEGNYTKLYFGTNKPLLPRTLAYMEERLDPSYFIRASRQHIVNMRAITSVESWYGGGLMLILDNGTKVEMSRRQAQKLREQMMI
jgi:two-component system, LytTR family, response regulator